MVRGRLESSASPRGSEIQKGHSFFMAMQETQIVQKIIGEDKIYQIQPERERQAERYMYICIYRERGKRKREKRRGERERARERIQ